jgi:hypothetical protein
LYNLIVGCNNTISAGHKKQIFILYKEIYLLPPIFGPSYVTLQKSYRNFKIINIFKIKYGGQKENGQKNNSDGNV